MNLRKLALALALTVSVGLSASAGEMAAPLCPTPDPGEMNSPPCSNAPLTSDDPTAGQTSTPPNGGVLTEYVVADTAIDFVESILSLF